MNSNTLEFFFKMKDMMSGGLVKMASTSKTAFGKIQQDVDNVKKKNDTLVQSYDVLQRKISDVEATISKSTSISQIRAAKKELAELEQMATKAPGNMNKGGGMFSNLLGGVGGQLLGGLGIVGGVAGTVEAVTSSLSASSEREQQRVNLETMTGDKKTGDNLLGSIIKMSDVTPFESKDLVENSKLLLQFGLNAKQVMPVLHQLGDISGANAEKMQSLSVAFGKTVSEGKLTGRTLQEMIFAGFNPLNELVKTTGKSQAELRKEMDKGVISTQMVYQAMEHATGPMGRFHNLMQKQSQTLGGLWSTMMDHIHNKLVSFGDVLAPVAKDIMRFVNEATEGFSGLGKSTSGWGVYFNSVKTNALIIWGYIKNIGLQVWHIVSGIIQFVKNSAILQDLFSFVGKLITAAWAVLSKFVDAISWMWDNVLKPILNAIDKVYRWLTTPFSKTVSNNNTTAVIASKGIVTKTPDVVMPDGGTVSFDKQNGTTAGDDETTKGITSGGPRIINFYGGIKFTDKFEMHTATFKEGIENIESVFEEMLLRILNSGATLQDAR